jgi:predicted Zn-dependent peptidase
MEKQRGKEKERVRNGNGAVEMDTPRGSRRKLIFLLFGSSELGRSASGVNRTERLTYLLTKVFGNR